MEALAALPFREEPISRPAHDELGVELLVHQYDGLRACQSDLVGSSAGSSEQGAVSLSVSTGLRAPLELPPLPKLEENTFTAEPATKASASAQEKHDATDMAAQERCFTACLDYRAEAVHRLLRRRVQCELERARALATMGSGTTEALASSSSDCGELAASDVVLTSAARRGGAR